MKSRGLVLASTLALSALGASCPRQEGAPSPAEPAAAPAAAVSRPEPAPAPKPIAAPAAVATTDPQAPLPPELVDDGADDRDAPPPVAPAPATPEPPKDALASVAKETWIFAQPRWSSRKLGYLRAGAVVARGADAVGFSSCDKGWYAVEPRGFVCLNNAATLDPHDPVVALSARRPSRGHDLPYTYVMSRFPTPPLYARLPTAAEQLASEPDMPSHLRKQGRTRADKDYVEPPADALPDLFAVHTAIPGLANAQRSPDALVLGNARTRSGFALLGTFDHDGRRFGLTTELALLPIDRTRVIRPSTFHGVVLDDAAAARGDSTTLPTLPLAFVKSRRAVRFHVDDHGHLERGEPLGFREAVSITEDPVRIAGVLYQRARDGSLLQGDQVVRVDRFREAPTWSGKGRKWIDVSILHQSLVAYEGDRAVYATLVSTGADGLGDPKKTHSTIQGAFLIHTKHVSVTMDGDDVGDEFDLRDVPFVQYFTEGFALHGAYWHDDFGTPRSHGCVNLAPTDAAWLFEWTTPEVPAAWHAALTLKRGTLVYIHP